MARRKQITFVGVTFQEDYLRGRGNATELLVTRRGLEVSGYYDGWGSGAVGMPSFFLLWEELDSARKMVETRGQMPLDDIIYKQ